MDPQRRAAALSALSARLRATPTQVAPRRDLSEIQALARFPDASAPDACAVVGLEAGGRGALSGGDLVALRSAAGALADGWFDGSAASQRALGADAAADAAEHFANVEGSADAPWSPVDPQSLARLRAAATDVAAPLGAVEREIALTGVLRFPRDGATLDARLRDLDRAADFAGGLVTTPARRSRRLDACFDGAERLCVEAGRAESAATAAFVDRAAARIAAERDPAVLSVLLRRALGFAARVDQTMRSATEPGARYAAPPDFAAAFDRLRDAAVDALLAASDGFATVAAHPAGVAELVSGSGAGRLRRAARLLAFLGADARYDRPHDDPRTVAIRAVLARLRDDVSPGDEPAPGLRALLAEPRGLFLESAYRAFDAAGRAALPAEILVRALRLEDEPSWIDALKERPDGLSLVRAAAARGLGVRTADAALRALADEARPLADVALAELLRLRPGLSWRAGDVVDAELAARAADRPQELAAALAEGGDVRARETLARTLGDARFVDVPWRADDGLAPALGDQLRARAGDAGAADAVRARLAALDEARSARRPASEDERAALLAALTTTLTPLDVVRFGAPSASPALTTRMAAWTDAALREALSAAAPAQAQAEGPEEDRRGSAAALLALLPTGRVDPLRADVVRWWDAHAASLSAAERIEAFGKAGAAQLDLLPRLMDAPPARAGEARRDALAAARVLVIESLDRRPKILAAAEGAALAAPDDEARLAYAQVRLAATGRSFRVRLTDGREILVDPKDPDAALAAVVARLAAEGWDAVRGFEPPLLAAWSAAVRARGAWID